MIEYQGKVVVIAGPTASGKSDIGLKLAKVINGYIINADSRQLYKELNIGTAKPQPDNIHSDGTWIIGGIEHYLYDMVSPNESFTLFEYQNAVQEVLERKKSSNQTPILLGGTGLYIDSVVFNYDLKQNDLTDDLSSYTLSQLQELAKDFLPDMSESDRSNRHRLIRAIQRGGLNKARGKPLDHMYFVIDVEKEKLRKKVIQRVNSMFEEGLEEENKRLLDKGYTYKDNALRSIGYQEFEEYFNGRKSIEMVKEDIIKHTMQYIKRQRTWFRRNKNSVWVNSYESIVDLASTFIATE